VEPTAEVLSICRCVCESAAYEMLRERQVLRRAAAGEPAILHKTQKESAKAARPICLVQNTACKRSLWLLHKFFQTDAGSASAEWPFDVRSG